MIYHVHVKPPNCLYFQCSYCVVCLKFMFPFGILQVNLYILKLLPLDQENHVLAHQVHCLAVLFVYFIDEASPSAKCSSAVDVGLCKPVRGNLLARSFRGRDCRKMISWKGMACTSGSPY